MIKKQLDLLLICTAFIIPIFLQSCNSDSSEEKTVPVQEMIYQNDSRYYVVDYQKHYFLGDSTQLLRPNGVFWVVRVKVDNMAKSGSNSWDNNLAYIVDSTGKEYPNNVEAQKLFYKLKSLQYTDEYTIKPGEHQTTFFMFDLPPDLKRPYLRFRGESGLGDLFGDNQLKNTKVKLFN